MPFRLVVEGDVQTIKQCRVWPNTVVTKIHVLYQLQPTRIILAMKFLPLLGRRKVCRPLKLAVCGRAHIIT